MTGKLEIIAFTIDSCVEAQKAGADRIELCDNHSEGGTTPSFAFIKQARKVLQIELFPMIRHRGGDFLYSNLEFEIMLEDVKHCRQLGCDGVVAGFLLEDGSVDRARASRFVDAAYPMETTFHRAFDRVDNVSESLEDIIQCGFTRVLTSGGYPTAIEGIKNLNALKQLADDRIIIMPGSGIRSANIEMIMKETGAFEIHSSARKMTGSAMQFTNLKMGESEAVPAVDGDEVRKMKGVMKTLGNP